VSPPRGLAAWLHLTLAPGIGGETQRKLLAAFGLPDHIFSAGRVGRAQRNRQQGRPAA
jgi:DNA processing protein